MSKILKNTTSSPLVVTDTGVTIPALSSYTIPPQDYLLWAASSNTVTFVGSTTLVVNDGSVDLTISNGIDLIKGIFPKTIKSQTQDDSGNGITSTTEGPHQALDVAIQNTAANAIPVFITSQPQPSNEKIKLVYNSISSIAAGATTNLVTYTVPISTKSLLQKVDMGGENIAKFDIYINGDLVGTKRTYFGGGLNTIFDVVGSNETGYLLNTGDVVLVTVLHNRPFAANFESTIQILEIT